MTFIPIIKVLGIRKSLLLSPVFFTACFSTSVSAQFLCREFKSGGECFSTSVSSQLFICREIKSGEKIYRDGSCNVKTERTLSEPSIVQQVLEETQKQSLSPEQAAKEALVAQITNPGSGSRARREAAAALLRHHKRPITELDANTASTPEKNAIDFLVSQTTDPNTAPRAKREAAAILLGVHKSLDSPIPLKQKNPVTFNHVGNMSLGSDGTIIQHFNGLSIGSNGTSYIHSGDTSFGSNGVTYNHSSTATYGSNGTVCNNFGAFSTCR